MNQVEEAGNTLASDINAQFQLSAKVLAIELNTVSDLNKASETFYAGMNERIRNLVDAARLVQGHALSAQRFSSDMTSLLQKARRLEAIVDRLDQYTIRQEEALSKK